MATGRLPDPNSAPVTAKGDLYTYSTVPAKLAVGNNGETLVADSSASTGLRWQGNFAAGKNKIINGDFNIWQRGTTITGSNGAYTADRFALNHNGTWGTNTVTRQSFTAGNEISGYESPFFWRWTTASPSGVSYCTVDQKIEDVRTFAGQTVTFSFWAKASATISGTPYIQFEQYFGSGGSASVYTSSQNFTITTSWQRFTYTVTVPSISGKTIGTGSFLKVFFNIATTAFTVDTWGWQLEAGNVATAFQTATGTLAGELAACQRYYYRVTGSSSSALLGTLGFAKSTTVAVMPFALPVTMRTSVSSIETGGTPQIADGTTGYSSGTWALDSSWSNGACITYTHGSAALTAFRPYFPQATTSTSYFGFNAEL